MSEKVYIGVYGSGLGHASRMTLIAKRLKERGISLRFSSSQEASQYILSRGFSVHNIPPVEVEWGQGGEVVFRKTVKKLIPSLGSLARQISDEVNHLREFKPSLVLADSRLSTVIAARYLGIPVIVILNQLRLLMPTRYKSLLKTVSENIGAELLGRAWSLSDEILIPDLPPPYTISERNLWGVRSPRRKINYIGFIVEEPPISDEKLQCLIDQLSLNNGKPTIFVPISGPRSTRDGLKNKMFQVASKLQEDYNFVISGGAPGSTSQPIRVRGGWYYDWCPVKDELFHLSDIIIARPGHLTIAQSIEYGKPMLSVPIPNYTEQLVNSRKISNLGLGVVLDQKYNSIDDFQKAISDLMYSPSVREKVGRLQDVSEKHDGLNNMMNIVNRVLGNNRNPGC